MITKNVKTRRDYLKQHSAAQGKKSRQHYVKIIICSLLILWLLLLCLLECSHSILPEYALPCVIHMLAHHPDFKQDDHETLVQFKE